MVIINLKIGHRSLTLQPTPHHHQHLKVRSGGGGFLENPTDRIR